LSELATFNLYRYAMLYASAKNIHLTPVKRLSYTQAVLSQKRSGIPRAMPGNLC
jgi:hypothetical protein